MTYSSVSAARHYILTGLVVFLMALPLSAATAQDEEAEDQKLSQEQLEQLVAPIALHPDSLVSQILMASTYPLQVVQAARWVEKNPKVTGDALEVAMEKENWDASVKSLTAFPQVIEMMNNDLGWTQQLGDAFLAQSEDVLAAVQLLRAKADKEGNLETTEQQTVETETVTTSSGEQKTVYVIQPASTETVYVPAYNPTVVYGTWPYPAYPPYQYYPPGYAAAGALWFGVGLLAGHALWGNCNWRGGNVDININRHNEFNRVAPGDRSPGRENRRWNHDPKHRGAVPYKDRKSKERFGNRDRRNAKTRENFRGRADRGRKDLKRDGRLQKQGRKQKARDGQRRSKGKKQARRTTGSGKKQTRRKTGSGKKAQRPSAGKKKQAKRNTRPQKQKRPSTGKKRTQSRNRPQKRSSAYRGAGRGKQTRQHSSRGRSSRSGGGRRGGGGGRRR